MLTSKISFALCFILIIVVPPEPPEPVVTSATANCSGWQLTSACPEAAFVEATAHLEKELNGVFIEVGTSRDDLLLPVGGGDIALENTWGSDLAAGTYRVRVDLVKYLGEFSATPTEAELDAFTGTVEEAEVVSELFDCAGNGFAEALTPGFWKNHEEVWADTLLPLGDPSHAYTQDELLVILNKKVQGDIRIILAKHLIASKLNLLAGANAATLTGVPDADSAITETIAAGDAYLAQFGAFDASLPACFPDAKPSGSLKQDGVFIKDGLDQFNNGQ